VLGEPARARYAAEQASGAVRLAEGAFDWAAGASAGVVRIYQPGIDGRFLTSEAQRFDVPTSTLYAERQFENGIRLRPGYLFTQEAANNFNPELARLNNRPIITLEVPLDRSFGEPSDALRLSAARSDLSAALTNRGLARQVHLHAVATTFWRTAAAQRRAAIDRALAADLGGVANRMARLAASGEVASAAAAEVRARASLAEAIAERSAVDVLAGRMELARLLALPVEQVAGVEGELPDAGSPGALDGARGDALVEEALARRPDLKAQSERVQAARLRGRIRERDAESKFSFTLGQDRVMLNYYTPLGDTRSSAARQASAADVGAAELALEDSRQRVRADTRLALERLGAAQRTVPRAAAAAQSFRERVTLVGDLVDRGRQPPAAMADAAEQLASASRQSLDARLLYALALADLRLATAAIPDDVNDPHGLAQLFVSLP
jgi:outer membrane protein TolC